jgi:AraC-like DNA-binding protein
MTVVFQASHDEPVSAHLEHWLHVVGETFGPAHVRPPRGANVPEHLVVGDVGAVRVSEMGIAWQPSTTEACQAARTPRLIRQSDPDPDQYRVDLVVRGRMVVEQAGLESALGPGDLAVVDLSRPARWATTVQEGVSLQFPRALLPLREDDVARISGARIPGDRGTGAVAFSFARQLVSRLDDLDAADGARLGTTMVDLVAAALAPHLEPEAGLPRRSRRQALLSTIYAFIERRLGDPELSPATIAAAHHVSPRYLYKLFETEPTGVAEWIRLRRLERCRRDLLDPALRWQPVSAIAARWGLTDPARFSRMFRSAYGVPPAEYRRLMGGPPA